MGKTIGVIGFSSTEETEPGIFRQVYREVAAQIDIINNSIVWKDGESVNSDLAVQNQISIIMDPYMIQKIGSIKYVGFPVLYGTNNDIPDDTRMPFKDYDLGGFLPPEPSFYPHVDPEKEFNNFYKTTFTEYLEMNSGTFHTENIVRYKVSSINIRYPRIYLTIGEYYDAFNQQSGVENIE